VKQIKITGGSPLRGRIRISGSKNSALPCIAAAILTNDQIELRNIPRISDVVRMIEILEHLNIKVKVSSSGDVISVDASSPDYEIPLNLSRLLRGSTLLLGALLVKCGRVKLYQPGGCPIGERPINLHLEAFRKLGAKIKETQYSFEISAKKLKGTIINFKFPSVGATENSIIAACAAKGETILTNVAIEPEIIDFIQMLSSMGATIKSDPEQRRITISGSKEFAGTVHRIIPDRIEAGTFAVSAGITKGSLEITEVEVNHLKMVMDTLEKMGIQIETIGPNRFRVVSDITSLKPVKIITEVYPGFPTDLQPQFASLATQALGRSSISETIYENRFHHIPELIKMGADIRLIGKSAIISGSTPLTGVNVQAMDIRGGIALVLAALTAKGTTLIKSAEIIDRGYEDVEGKLSSIGAEIEVTNNES
jgi:UDP-N-acetylglucosamine 1-carboxyvinyltransferase